MASAFSQVLNMSLTGSLVILLVMLARLVLKRSPKIFSYVLWAVVLFRLLCPVSLSAPVSALEMVRPEVVEASGTTSVVSYLPAAYDREFDLTFIPAENVPGDQATAGQVTQESVDVMAVAAYVWIIGVIGMLLYSAAAYFRLRRKLVGAMVYRGNVYLADYIDSPFVMGVLRPRIYLPSAIPMKERKFIIAHERHHIRRFDHIVKLLAYGALCIHWFNPLVWAAFFLAGKDMEMSCDEAVIRKLGPQIRADYSEALLRLATHRKIIAGMPLAFGEGDTKGRVMNMAKWKKPRLWVSIVCLLLCGAVLVACAVNPSGEESVEETAPAQTENALMAQTEGSPFQMGQLPEGFAYVFEESLADENYVISFSDGTNIVGGVACYPIPEGVYDPDDTHFFWLEEVGIPDFEDSSLCYMGGISNFNGGWDAEFANDVPEGTEPAVSRRHTFYVVGDAVYDIWFDMLLIRYDVQQELVSAVEIGTTDSVEATESSEEGSAEDIAFAACGAVMEAVQNGSYQITQEQKNDGNQGPSGYTRSYCWHDGDFLNVYTVLAEGENVTDAGDYYSRHAYLSVGERWFSNEGHQGESGNIVWAETDPMDVGEPWLARFLWVRSSVTYIDTLTDEDGTCYMYRIDKMYEDLDGYSECYFVNFNFDPDGNFRNVRIQVNLFQDNAFTATESIVSLDPETVAAEIDEEYRRAIE